MEDNNDTPMFSFTNLSGNVVESNNAVTLAKLLGVSSTYLRQVHAGEVACDLKGEWAPTTVRPRATSRKSKGPIKLFHRDGRESELSDDNAYLAEFTGISENSIWRLRAGRTTSGSVKGWMIMPEDGPPVEDGTPRHVTSEFKSRLSTDTVDKLSYGWELYLVPPGYIHEEMFANVPDISFPDMFDRIVVTLRKDLEPPYVRGDSIEYRWVKPVLGSDVQFPIEAISDSHPPVVIPYAMTNDELRTFILDIIESAPADDEDSI